MLDDFLLLDVLKSRFCATLSLLGLCWHRAFSFDRGARTACRRGCWRGSIYSVVAVLGRGRLEMRRRFPSLTLRCGGSVDVSYVAVDSEQTVRLHRKINEKFDAGFIFEYTSPFLYWLTSDVLFLLYYNIISWRFRSDGELTGSLNFSLNGNCHYSL